eukprot:COSAG02_NODE_42824_length_381_cov_0.464539_1_plen_77_part_10
MDDVSVKEQSRLVHDDDQPAVPSYWALLCKEQSSLACTAYMFSTTNFVVFDEMLPLFCKETVESGGLSWDTAQIGLS